MAKPAHPEKSAAAGRKPATKERPSYARPPSSHPTAETPEISPAEAPDPNPGLDGFK